MDETQLWRDLLKEGDPKRSELLVKYGFIKKDALNKYQFNKEKAVYEPALGYEFNSEDAAEENTEILKDQYGKTGFPASTKRYKAIWEVYDLSLEEPYFWVLDSLKENFPEILKLEDSFAAAENSAFFGVTQQRLGAQQDKVSQYLATTGKMIKEMFQMVRELRILDERLGYYDDVDQENKKSISQRGKSSDITLKGVFIDLVQGGGKSASSVYGMARELEFVTLPDLFFDAPPLKNKEELQGHLVGLSKDFNRNVIRVLERHLLQYIEWRFRTGQEHRSRKRFMLQYLLQHFRIIQMYIVWIKPYLKHVAKLNVKESRMRSPDLVSAFEGSMLDVEILAKKKKGKANECILVTFNYRTRPELKVVQEGYQRGPVHIGKMELNLRVYGWTDEEIKNYIKLKEKETMLLMSDISGAVFNAMEALGEELDRYIAEAKGEEYKEKGEEKKTSSKVKKTFMEKFLGDFYTPSETKAKMKGVNSKELRQKVESEEKAKKEAAASACGTCWTTYNNFKKSRGMISW